MANRLYSVEELEAMAEHTKIEMEWLQAYFDLLGIKGYDRDREIVITPFEGHYGFAGVVIAINGSPMRGTMLVKSSCIREQVDTAECVGCNRIDGMYVLHGSRPPKRLSDPDMYHHKTKSKQVALWRATHGLLVERGMLKK